MPGDIGRIPIISLGGCKPLSDIINELPVPQSTHVSIGCRTLLYEPKLVHEAYRCINGDDPRLFNTLCSALKSVCTDDLTFQNCPQAKSEETTTYPLLLQALLANETFSRADGCLEANAIRDLNPVSCPKGLPPSSDDLSNNGVLGAVVGQQENSDRESYCSTRIAPLRISLKKTSITCNNSEQLSKSKKTRRKERPQPNNEIPTPSKDTQRLPSSNELIGPGSAGEIGDCRCVLSDSRESVLCTAKMNEKPLSPMLLNLAPTVSSGLTNHEQYSSAGAAVTSSCTAVHEQPVNVIDVNDNFKEAACSVSSNVIIQSPLGLTSLNDVPPSTNTDCFKPIGSVAPTSNPENVPTATRRVPDPALSQLFHSAALFHTCQPSVDCEKSGLVVSGGLFDDWLDPSGKSSEAVSVSTNNPTVSTECTYSGSISGPSSVTGNPSTCGQAPHSVGTAFDTSTGVTRSPQSVPSNYSSYPATPGAGFPNVPLSVITSIVTPPSVLAKSAITNSAISPPSIRLFDNPESRPDIHESSVDDQPRTAPHGLAAYLPRSSSLRSQLVNEDPATGLFFEELRPGSPRSNLSSGWDCSDPRSVSASEAGSRPTSTGKGLPRTICSANDGLARHYNESPLPTKPSRGRFPAGKPRGGGRRRRTEVEELRIWNVNDRGQPGTDRKPENGPPAFTSPLLHELKESTVDKIAASNTITSVPNSGSTIGKRKDIPETAEASEHGLFTEALVERVKRRRQQLEMGAQKQTLQLDVPVNRSSEASPSSVSSPLRPSGRSVSSSSFIHTSKYLSIPSTNSESQLDSTGRAPTDNSKSQSTATTIPYKSRRIRSSDSESSLSPSSSALSSVPSNQRDVSISSCPDSVPPLSLEELPSNTPVTRTVNKTSAQPSIQPSSSPLRDNDSKTHEPSQVMSAYKSGYAPSELIERDCPILNFSECSNVSSSQFMNEESHHRPTANNNANTTHCDDESKTLLPPRLEEITMTNLKTDNQSPDNLRKHGYHTSGVERLPSLVPLIPVPSNKTERNKQESVKHTVDKLCHSEDHNERYTSATVSMKADCERESCLTVSDSGVTENSPSRSSDRCEETIVVSQQNSTTVSCAPSACYQHDGTKLLSVASKEVPTDKASDASRNVADPTDNNSVTVSEQSTGSIDSSSSPLPGTYGELYGSGQRCLTPSTIPYTHSSGMEDSDPRENDCVPLPGENKRHRNGTASSADSDDLSSCRSSIASERSSSRSKFSSPSPSVTSLLEEDGGHCSADNDSDAERIRSEELTISASALTQFTNRLGEILRRVEELDLLKLASNVGLPKSANFHGDDEFCGDSSLIPITARLSRHELSALYTESAQIRLGGAMYTIPTGRLVRFLTLLLVNMQTGVQLPTSPLTTAEVVRFLERRNKHRHDGSRRIQADQVTESVLWSTPYWTAVLTGLDCVRIALNIVVAPDMPRPLLMEDLVDGIISVTKHALAEILCKIPASVLACTVRQSGQPAGLSMKNLWTFTTECIGYRVSQIMAVLTNLIRFQPNRFTDNLVIRLTGLGLYVPLFCLKSGRSLDRDPKRLSTPLLKRLYSSTSTASESGSSGVANMLLPIGTSRFWLLVWPGHLQRASLSLLAGVYGQYEAHRKLIVDEIFSTLLALCSVPSNGSDNSVTKEIRCSPPGDRRTARTFRILSSHWLYTMSKQLKSRTELREDYDPSGVVQSIDASKGQLFVDVHVLTALFLSLTQNLVQVPGSTSTGSVSGSGGGSRKSSVGSTEQSNGENAQFCKDEKHVLISYQTAVRHAHYLLSGLFKRLCSKTESDLRPVLETVTNDLISVANLASVEWPVSLTFISVLSGLVIQHLSQNGNVNSNNPAAHSSVRTIDLCSKLTYIDTVTTLAIGLKRCFPTPSIRTDINDRTRSVSETVKTTAVESTRTREALAQARLIAFLSSPIPMVNNWMFEPGVSASQVDDLSTRWSRLDRECMQCIRLGYTDSLVLAAQRFHLASWLYDCSRELGELTNSSKSGPDLVSTKNGGPKSVHELEQLRHQLLSELAMTHHTTPTSLSWLTGCRHSGAVVGSSSLSSPTYSNRLSRNNTAGSQIHGASGSRNGSCSTPNKFLGFGGSILAPNAAAQRFVDCAHTRHLDSRCRLHFAAHAHWSARKLTSIRTVSPGFEKLFGVICRLIGEPSVPVRTKALRSLASIVELDPSVFEITRKPCETQSYCTTRCSAWLRDLPRLVHARLLDSSTAVREAAVDLVSRLLLVRPRMLPEYYPMLAERVLDKGVSVRKRAIRCFRDLLIVDWDNVAKELNRTPVRYKGTLMVRQLGIEMCLKLIRRLHDDEESIQKLVVELFHNLWFTPISETNMNCSKLLDRRIVNLSAVTLSLRSGNFDTIEAFVKQILTVTDLAKSQQLDLACAQLVNRLAVRVKKLSAPFFSSDPTQPFNRLNPPRIHSNSVLPAPTLQCLLATLHLIGRCKPKLLISHCKFFFDFLHKAPLVPTGNSSTVSVSSGTQANDASSVCMDAQSMFHLLNIIEMTLSAFSAVSESTCEFSDIEIPEFVSQNRLHDLQRDLIRLIQRQGRLVVDSSLCCLATLVNRVLKDHSQVAVCFRQFYGLLTSLSFELRRTVSTKVMNAAGISSRTRPSVLRALYTVGLMCKHFRLEDLANEYGRVSTSTPVLDDLVDTLMLFAEYAAAPVLTQTSDDGSLSTNSLQHMHDPDLCRKAVMGLGFVVCRHDQLLCTKRVRTFFSRFFIVTPLAPSPGSSKPSPFHEVQCIILDNLTHYLMENERQMVADSRQWAAMHKSESLKELTDRRSGHGSAIAQEYLPMVLKHCVLNFSLNVRTSALSFLSVILRQGLVHPVQMLPSLVCLQTDPDSGNRSRASHLLVEAERKVPGFIAMRAATGVQMTYRLHLLWHVTALDTDRCAAPLPLVRGVNQDGLASTPGSVVLAANGNLPTALNHAVYTMLRPNRQGRRSFVSSVLSVFANDQKPVDTFDVDKLLSNLMPVGASSCSLGQMIFIADQLAHFPYTIQDEVFYVAFSVERLVSDCGPSLLRLMHQALLSSMLTQAESHSINRTEKDNAETHLLNVLELAETKLTTSKISSLVDSGTSDLGDWDQGDQVQNLFKNARPANLCQQVREAMVRTGPVCLLLLAVRNHLREIYGVTDSKLKDYSPTDAPKQWDKPVQITKRPNSSNPVLRLPTWVVQCMQNPTWFDLSDVPPDALLLAQFIRLRHQLLSLEGGASGELIKSEPEDSESILKSEQDNSNRRSHMAGRNTYIGPKGDDESSTDRIYRESSVKIKPNLIGPCDTSSNSNTKQPYVDSASESHGCQLASQLSSVRKRRAVRRSSISSLSSSSSDSPIIENSKHLKPHKGKSSVRSIGRSSSQLHRSSDKTQSGPPHHLEHQNRYCLDRTEQRVPRPIKKQPSTSSELDSDSDESQPPANSINPKRKQQSSGKPELTHHCDAKRLPKKLSQDANRFEGERSKSLSNQDTRQKSHPPRDKEKHGPRSHVSAIPENHLKTHRHTAANYGVATSSKCKQTDQLGRTSSNSVRSLAPLPQAMMQPTHASRSVKKKSTHDNYTSRRSQESHPSHGKPTAVAVMHRTTESPIKPPNQTSNASSHHAASNTVRHSVKPRHSMKPQTVRKLSDSSSLSSGTDDDDRKSTNSSLSSSTVSTVSTPSDCSLSSSSTTDPPVKVKKSRKLVS